jgi:hypothetical protein
LIVIRIQLLEVLQLDENLAQIAARDRERADSCASDRCSA